MNRLTIQIYLVLSLSFMAFANAQICSQPFSNYNSNLLDAHAILDTTNELKEILRKTEGITEQRFLSLKQADIIFKNLQVYAESYNINFKKIKETVGVFPKGLYEVGYSGFGGNSHEDKKASYVLKHELTHLFHVLLVRVSILKAVEKNSSNNENLIKQGEEYLKRFEGGKNYLELEKAVSITSSLANLINKNWQTNEFFIKHVEYVIDVVSKSMTSEVIKFPNSWRPLEIYALILSRAPYVVGRSALDLALRMPLIMFITFYLTQPAFREHIRVLVTQIHF